MTVRFLTSWNGYSAGDRATLTNEAALISAGIARADYVQDGASPLYPPNRNDATAVVGAAGVSIAEADLLITTGKTDLLYVVSDGDNRGAKLVWAVPENETVETWCWWLWPQSAFEI